MKPRFFKILRHRTSENVYLGAQAVLVGSEFIETNR